MSSRKSNLTVPPGWSTQDKRFADGIKENLDVILGHRGDPLQRAVTFQDLLDAKIVELAGGVRFFGDANDIVPVANKIPQLDVPPAPTNLQASGAFQNIILNWNLSRYQGHSFVEVFRHTSDDIAAATMVAQVSGFTGVYADPVGSGQSFYYWVRAINVNGVSGPFNTGSGTQGQTAPDVDFLLTALTNEITSSQLASDLSGPIGNLPADTSTAITNQATSIDGLSAKYVVKIDNNGAVAGYGLASTTNSAGNIVSEFIVNADRFAIMRGGSNTTAASVPFVVQASSTTLNGVSVPAGVYMQDGFIKNGSIVNAKIGNAAIDNAKIASLDAGKISSGKIATSRLRIDSNFLSVDGSDQLQLVTSNGSNGVKIENLSNDAVGTIHFANLNYKAAADAFVSGYVSYYPSFDQFTASTPYYSGPTTLPQLLQTTIHKDKIKETGDYQLDFGGVVIGSAGSGGACAIVAEVEDSSNNITWTSRYHLHTNSYSGQSHILATMFNYGDIALTANKYVRVTLYGYKVFVNNNPSGQNGFGNLFIRVFRIAKNT